MVSRSTTDPDFNPSQVLLDDLCARLPKQQFETWFRGTPIAFEAPNRIVITVASQFHKSWFESQFAEEILRSARATLELEPELDFRFPDGTSIGPSPSSGDGDGSSSQTPFTGRSPGSAASDALSMCSPVKSTANFDNVVVGPCNRIAVAASLGVTDDVINSDDELQYNPLVICGTSGFGKTLLLQSCFHRMRSNQKRMPLYLTAESFTNRLLDALKQNTQWNLFRKLRAFDALILDDIHFLADKGRVQEELYNILDDFVSKEKQVIVSSSRSMAQLKGFSDRLRSRLRMGLVTRLDKPGLEFRVEILKRHGRRLGHEIPDQLAETIACDLSGGPRELEGAVTQLLQVANSGPLMNDIFKHFIESGGGGGSDAGDGLFDGGSGSGAVLPVVATPSMSDILRAVARHYRLRSAQIISTKRDHSLVLARQVAMFLCRELTPNSLERIGRHFKRNHATVIHSVRKISGTLEDSSKQAAVIRADLDAIRETLRK